MHFYSERSEGISAETTALKRVVRNLKKATTKHKNLLRAMRFTAFILLTACLAASAKGLTQQVTIKVKDASLKEVFKEIKKQTGYTFAYNEVSLKEAKKVSLELHNATIEQVLNACFNGQPFSYEIVDKIVVVKYQPLSPNADATNIPLASDLRPLIDISGKITDGDGNPLAGATIKLKGTSKGTTTNNEGIFSLKGIDQNAVLEISYVGFETITVSVNNKSSIALSLKRLESKLDEMQVIAYGTKSKRFQTGNVFTVKAEDIAKQPVNNPLLALEGRVPGLQIQQATGYAGSGAKVRIQGENSINGGNDPLYVVDGVPFVSQMLPSINWTQGSSGGRVVNNGGLNFATFGNPLSYINPADIESIEVLKDADATAIYGSQAANGAILITTKKGKPGEQRIEFNLQQGWGKVTRKMDLLDRRQFLDMRYEALKNDGVALSSLNTNNNYDLTVWDTTRYTDWQKELIGNTAHYTDLQSSVTGGNANSSYSIGAGYHKETVVIPGDFDDQKASLHFQVGSTSSNQKFKLRLSGNYMVDINKLPASLVDLTKYAVQLAPVAPALLNSDGSINWAPNPAGVSTWGYPDVNPMALLLQKYIGTTHNLVSNALLSYQVIPGLSLKTSLGYTYLHVNETTTIAQSSVMPEMRATHPNTGIYGNSDIASWIIEPQATYEKNLFGGKLEALAGSTIQQRNSNGQKFEGFGFLNENLISDIHAAGRVQADPSIQFTYKYNAAFGRLNYIWGQKYILNVTGRRDGSSRFGAENHFHNFWSTAGSWIFTQDKSVKELFPFLSFGKIKASYGTTGNDQVGDYQYLSIYNTVNLPNLYQGITTLQTNSLANPYLQWEETKKTSVGLNLGFLKDRILVEANYYRNISSNQLLGYQLAATTGFGSITENFPATVQNTGLEFVVNSSNIESKNFHWSTTFNLTIPRNKLLSFPGIESSSYASILVIGEPTTIVKRLHYLGVDPTTGVYYFNSKSNPFNPKIPDDANVIINTSPTLYGGIENSFSYMDFQLDFLLQAVKQSGTNYYFGNLPGQMRLNQPSYILDRWQAQGNNNGHQKFNSNQSISGGWLNAMNSDAAYSDASYIRLKNVSLSWQMPNRIIQRMHLHGLRIFTQGQNLLTFTKYKGLDPETMSSTSLPPLRVLTVGIQITL